MAINTVSATLSTTLSASSVTIFTDDILIEQQTGTTIRLKTDKVYTDKNIELNLEAITATPVFKGGAISGTAAAAYTNATVTSTNISGVKVIASATANRAIIQYDGLVDGWVIKANNATAVNALSNQALTTETKYISGVTINNSKSFNITIPNGASTTITLNFAVDANGNTVIT